MAIGGDGAVLKPQTVDTPAGQRVYYTVYLIGAESVQKPSGVLARAASLLAG